MTRDKKIYGRTLRLGERLRMRRDTGRITVEHWRTWINRLSLAHYRQQHRAGASDYSQEL